MNIHSAKLNMQNHINNSHCRKFEVQIIILYGKIIEGKSRIHMNIYTTFLFSYISVGYCENDTNMLLNNSAIFDHFCSQNDILPTEIYIHIMIIVDRITIVNHFNKIIGVGMSAYTKA